jgi:molybdopterin-guanine dinucleotide biosynthesis protein A
MNAAAVVGNTSAIVLAGGRSSRMGSPQTLLRFGAVPFLNLRLIRSLLAAFGDADVVVPLWQRRLQPLHAVSGRSVMNLLKRQLDDGKLHPTFLCDQVKTRIVTEEEVRCGDPEGLSFINLNTPEDYHQALRRW